MSFSIRRFPASFLGFIASYLGKSRVFSVSQRKCPVTAIHMANARRIPRGILYVLDKPSKSQKIDLVMASVLAHEAAADAHLPAGRWSVRSA